MVLWDETERRLGLTEFTARSSTRVVTSCDNCGVQSLRALSYHNYKTKKVGRFLCHSCATGDEFRKGCSERTKKLWKDNGFRTNSLTAARSSEHREKQRKLVLECWKDPEYRVKVLSDQAKANRTGAATEASKKFWADPECRARLLVKLSNAAKKLWEQDSYRQAVLTTKSQPAFIERHKLAMASPDVRLKAAISRRNMPKVSSIQTLLYSILDDLGVKYFREHADGLDDLECTIGPYSFDCVVPRYNKPTLLLECQGEYWHSLPKHERNDRSKATYITNNFPKQYELKYLWEHEFACKDKVQETLKYWLGLGPAETIEYQFKDLVIKKSPTADYRLLLGKYHYLPNAGRGGIAYGAYLGSELIAVCVFSPLIRQNITISGYIKGEVVELSRLCLHPKYHKKNVLSWFVSRCLKLLDKKFKCVISYCDTTYNHNGAVYKACNFELDAEVPPDYWYTSPDGWIMHKRTLYGHAIKLGVTEAEYTRTFNYQKIWGMQKLRYIYQMNIKQHSR